MRSTDGLRNQLDQVRRRIQAAAHRCGRPAEAVTLVGVTKGMPAEVVEEAVRLGLSDVGENRVQEARDKQTAVGRRPKAEGRDDPARWHLVGHLQRNKVKLAVELFDVIHSVDSLPLVTALEGAMSQRLQAEPPLDVLIQVNVSGEPTKSGCPPNQVIELAIAVRGATHLRLAGLMTMAPFDSNPEAARPHFRQLRNLRDEAALASGLQPSALGLSMGMSQDFEVAIEEGADLVRIGTALFGPRE